MNQDHALFFQQVAQSKVPEYTQTYFDSLYSEYRALLAAGKVESGSVKDRLEEINKRRQDGALTWNDVYEFDLALLEILPTRDLVRRAYDMRAKYRSIAGSKDYDAYIASKPPDLTTLDSKADEDSPDAPVVTVDTLRADIRYLVRQVYLYYALLPFREGFRDELTRRARNTTLIIFIVIGVLIAFGFGVERTPRSVIAVVAFAGIIGGCVSMLQRIQSAPSEGDALYNLASLANGWKGISLSPLYGAIFATLLFVLFSAGILKGTIFPVIKTLPMVGEAPAKLDQKGPTSTDQPKATETQANAQQPVDKSTTPTPSPTASATATPSLSATQNNSPAPTPSPGPSPAAAAGISFSDFLKDTYPESGTSYALLVVWSFIAGFAERLVPDTLNRLVAKNQSIQGTSS